MHLRSIVALAATIFVTQFAQAEEKPVHIFILSGQSNMGGMNPKAGFEPEAQKLFADEETVYFKVASGGKPIRLWVSQWNEIAEKHELDTRINATDDGDGTIYYKPILDQFKQLLEKHPEPATVTFCWMQGERDARENLGPAYADAMKQLIANLRRDLNQPKINFVIGRISDFSSPSYAHWDVVRKAQVDVANGDERGAWVDCDDLNNKERNGEPHNDLHYTADGYELLGRRFARQAKALIDGQEPAKDGRPE